MKKILLTSIVTAAACVGAFGQGMVLFENADNSSVSFTLNSPTGPPTGSGLVVELFWNNGSSFVLEDTFTSTYTGRGTAVQGPGYFQAGVVTIPNSGTQTFYVEASYATGGTIYTGATASFTARVNALPAPPLGTDTGGWNGSLVLGAGSVPVPEPSTIALGGLGAAAWLLFRRRK
jgi:PEP-CTERM motif